MVAHFRLNAECFLQRQSQPRAYNPKRVCDTTGVTAIAVEIQVQPLSVSSTEILTHGLSRRAETRAGRPVYCMSKDYTVKVHEIATDGLPDMDNLVGRVAFIHDGDVYSGWPVTPEDGDVTDHFGENGVLWESSSDFVHGLFSNVTHWIEWPVPEWQLGE
jgi:hypothetical protein